MTEHEVQRTDTKLLQVYEGKTFVKKKGNCQKRLHPWAITSQVRLFFILFACNSCRYKVKLLVPRPLGYPTDSLKKICTRATATPNSGQENQILLILYKQEDLATKRENPKSAFTALVK